jgi:hypothetical protein
MKGPTVCPPVYSEGQESVASAAIRRIYLPNGREHLNSAKTGESGVKNWICLNYFRFLGPIAEWEKKVGSMDLVHLSGGLLVK